MSPLATIEEGKALLVWRAEKRWLVSAVALRDYTRQ